MIEWALDCHLNCIGCPTTLTSIVILVCVCLWHWCQATPGIELFLNFFVFHSIDLFIINHHRIVCSCFICIARPNKMWIFACVGLFHLAFDNHEENEHNEHNMETFQHKFLSTFELCELHKATIWMNPDERVGSRERERVWGDVNAHSYATACPAKLNHKKRRGNEKEMKYNSKYCVSFVRWSNARTVGWWDHRLNGHAIRPQL